MGQGDASSTTFDLNNNDQTVAGLGFSSAGGTKQITNSGASLHTFTLTNAGTAIYHGVFGGNLNLAKSVPAR